MGETGAMRAIGAQTRTIDGLSYEVTPLPTGKAIQALALFNELGGPALARVILGGSAAAEKTQADPEAAARALGGAVMLEVMGSLADRVKGPKLEELLRLFAEDSRVQPRGQPATARVPLGPIFDEHFRGRLPALYHWVRLAGDVNIAPLFAALSGDPALSPDATAAAPTPTG